MRGLALFLFLTAATAHAHDPLPHEIEELDEALEERGPVAELLVLRAHLWMLNGGPQLALNDLDLAEALESRQRRAVVVRARALRALSRDTDALHVLRLGPPSYGSRMIEGELLEDRSEHAEALRAFEYAATEAVTVDVSLARGRCLRALRRGSEEIVVYQEALRDLAGATLVQRELTRALVSLNRFDEAREVIRDARRHTRESVLWDIRDARVLRQMGRRRAAKNLLCEVQQRLEARLLRRPTAARWLQHAQVMFELQRTADARRSARRSLTLAPNYAPTLAFAEGIGL